MTDHRRGSGYANKNTAILDFYMHVKENWNGLMCILILRNHAALEFSVFVFIFLILGRALD